MYIEQRLYFRHEIDKFLERTLRWWRSRSSSVFSRYIFMYVKIFRRLSQSHWRITNHNQSGNQRNWEKRKKKPLHAFGCQRVSNTTPGPTYFRRIGCTYVGYVSPDSRLQTRRNPEAWNPVTVMCAVTGYGVAAPLIILQIFYQLAALRARSRKGCRFHFLRTSFPNVPFSTRNT